MKPTRKLDNAHLVDLNLNISLIRFNLNVSVPALSLTAARIYELMLPNAYYCSSASKIYEPNHGGNAAAKTCTVGYDKDNFKHSLAQNTDKMLISIWMDIFTIID